MIRVPLRAALGALVCLSLGGCPGSEPAPTATGTTCPPGSSLTYENFGKDFMERYCTRCHSSELHGAERSGAPLYHDFDSLIGILNVWEHVDQYAAAGPNAVNELMPPNGDTPSLTERTELGEWLPCAVERFTNPADAGSADAL